MNDSMRIAIVGFGAMGSVYAGLLAEAGNDVVAVSRDNDHVRAVCAKGLRLSGPGGDRVIELNATTMPAGPPVDLVVLATKAFQVADAMRGAAPITGPDTIVLTLQNGLGAADEIASIVDPDRLAIGIAAAFGAGLRAPGHAHHESLGRIGLGAYAGLAKVDLDRIAAIWTGAGLATTVTADIAAMQWEKLICNVAYSGICGATGHTVGEVMDSPDLAPVSEAAAIEAFDIARKAGIALTVDDPVALVRAFGTKVREAKPSVLLDMEAGRRSEIDFINGAIDRVARSFGAKAPVNATITALVRDRESGLSSRARGDANSSSKSFGDVRKPDE